MDKEENYSASFSGLDYSLDCPQHHQEMILKPSIGKISCDNNHGMIDYRIYNPQSQHHQQQQQLISSSGFWASNSFDKLSFADVMQFADFPVLNDKLDDDQSLMVSSQPGASNEGQSFKGLENKGRILVDGEDEEIRVSDRVNSGQHRLLGGDHDVQNETNNPLPEGKNKRKRPRAIKTTEEVEGQRMTHIAVERNRRKQMNEHLRVLRSLMPGSYMQRGDQASIIGGAIEFARELEQLLQCLESQKRRRLFGEVAAVATPGGGLQIGDSCLAIQPPQPQIFPRLSFPNDQIKIVDFETGLREETAENKSCLADVEVKILGFDAMIKILSRRRPGQLIKAIAAFEDLQFNILHTNITTIEQTVLYSFNVKVASESRLTAEDIASLVQQIFSLIHAKNTI